MHQGQHNGFTVFDEDAKELIELGSKTFLQSDKFLPKKLVAYL